MKKLYFLFILISIFSCKDHKLIEENLTLKEEITVLKKQIEDYENGSEKILAKIQLAFDEKNNDDVKSYFEKIKKIHPESKEFKKANELHNKILDLEKEEKEEKELLVKKEKENKLKALKSLKKKHDDVSNIDWYNQRYFTHYNNTNLTSIYMGDKGGNPWIRLTMSYTGDDWIFFKKAYLSYDGNTIEIPFNEYEDKKTDNDGGDVWEWIDVSIDDNTKEFLREMANSKNAKMRLSGKYTETRKLTYNERRGILAILDGYEALNET